jgi:hypothetical protein
MNSKMIQYRQQIYGIHVFTISELGYLILTSAFHPGTNTTPFLSFPSVLVVIVMGYLKMQYIVRPLLCLRNQASVGYT